MNANTESESDEEETSPLDLWRALRDYICAACALFGAPAALASRRVVPRDEYKGFLVWLGACENLLRKLLFLDAVKYGPPAPSPASGGAGRRGAGGPCGPSSSFTASRNKSLRSRFSQAPSQGRKPLYSPRGTTRREASAAGAPNMAQAAQI